MNEDNLSKVAHSLVNFLCLVRNNVIMDVNKNFKSLLNGLDDCMSDFSIPPSHTKVILFLAEFNSSAISQIADNLGISKSNMTPIIDTLITNGLVNRYPDPTDRRILRVELTRKSYTLLDTFRSAICDSFIEKISPLSDDDVILLDDSISNLINILKKLN